MGRVLVCWIGHADLRAARGQAEGPGPIAQVVEAGWVDEALLLSDYPDDEAGAYVAWLRARSRVAVTVRDVDLSSPTDFGEIYRAATKAVDGLLSRGVREGDALHRGVRDVPLVPQGDVLQSGRGVATQETGEAGDVLGGDRVALVGHGR